MLMMHFIDFLKYDVLHMNKSIHPLIRTCSPYTGQNYNVIILCKIRLRKGGGKKFD